MPLNYKFYINKPLTGDKYHCMVGKEDATADKHNRTGFLTIGMVS